MKRALAAFLALMLAAGLFGCAPSRTEGPAAETAPTPTPVPTPEPTPAPEGAVEPQEMNWGMGGEDKTEPDVWVPVKGEETRALYFAPGEGEVLCTVTWVDESGRDTADSAPCVAEGMNLKTMKDAPVEADFVFPDTFTAFDRETDTTYSRGDYAALAAKIAGRTFVSQADETRTYSFGADFSVVEVYREQEYPGIWVLDTPTVLSCIFDDDPGYAYRYEIVFNAGGAVEELYMGESNRFSPLE